MQLSAEAQHSVDAFDRLVRPELTHLRRFATSLVGWNDCEDLVQETVTRAWEKRALYSAERGPVRAWLFAILIDKARRRVMHHGTIHLLEVSEAPAADLTVHQIDLRRAVEQLPPRQRLAVVLHYYLDLPQDEVAAVLGCSVGTVKSNLHDARRVLARKLGEHSD